MTKTQIRDKRPPGARGNVNCPAKKLNMYTHDEYKQILTLECKDKPDRDR